MEITHEKQHIYSGGYCANYFGQLQTKWAAWQIKLQKNISNYVDTLQSMAITGLGSQIKNYSFWNFGKHNTETEIKLAKPILQAWQTAHIETDIKTLKPVNRILPVSFSGNQINMYRLPE